METSLPSYDPTIFEFLSIFLHFQQTIFGYKLSNGFEQVLQRRSSVEHSCSNLYGGVDAINSSYILQLTYTNQSLIEELAWSRDGVLLNIFPFPVHCIKTTFELQIQIPIVSHGNDEKHFQVFGSGACPNNRLKHIMAKISCHNIFFNHDGIYLFFLFFKALLYAILFI